jgi:type II secretory pathway component PulF
VTFSTALFGLLTALIGGVLGSFIRSRPALRKIDADREGNLLRERAEEMAEMRRRILKMEDNQNRKEKLFEAERALYRHQINNLDGAFSALLMLLKKGVSVEEAVDAVEKMRAEQLARETIEKAALRALEIKAGVVDPEP